jgi:hypothetical protein
MLFDPMVKTRWRQIIRIFGPGMQLPDHSISGHKFGSKLNGSGILTSRIQIPAVFVVYDSSVSIPVHVKNEKHKRDKRMLVRPENSYHTGN